MALDLTPEGIGSRIDALRSGWSDRNQLLLARSQAYLRAFSPDFETRIGEHDQWPDKFLQEQNDHFRSSYNLARPVAELWASLEASEFPAIRWTDGFVPTPAPSQDEAEAARRQMLYRAMKVVNRNVSTLREQTLNRHLRAAKAKQRLYHAILRKNVYGHSWLKTWPDMTRRRFRIVTSIDPSTVYPVWSYADDDEARLEAVLVAYRRTAQSVNAEFPGFLPMDRDGLTVSESGYYVPTQTQLTGADRHYVWVEDYWLLDDEWVGPPGADGQPIRSRVINATRINGRFPDELSIAVHDGWKGLPYVPFENDNLRDRLGFSDVATMLPFQDSTNRFMSQQQDVIAGESRPRFKFRSDSDRQIVFTGEDVIPLDPDEDIEQLQVRLDVFPTQVHGQQLIDLMSRATGLPDTVWGRITSAQNSGRALATAWRAVAARLVPRVMADDRAIHRWLDLWLDWMELYGWDQAKDLYAGDRDYELEFPNQEPRDFTEVTQDAIVRMNAGVLDRKSAIEATGQASPDEVIEDIRADYLDTILNPDKAQSYLLLAKARQDMEIQAQQAGLQQAALVQQMQGSQGVPTGPSTEQAAGAADQARTQAAQQAAPTRGPADNQPAPATQAGQAANPIQTGTMMQDGKTFNRFIQKGQIQ